MMRRALPLLAALAAFAPARSDACMNAVLATEKSIAGVKEAEQILNDGDPAKAQRRIKALLDGADRFREETPSAKGLNERAQRILALADIRLDAKGRSDEYREAILSDAVETMKRLARTSPNDAAKQSDLGEALERSKPGAAKKILDDLATRDLVTHAYAYAALARLRGADGDEKGRDAALARCNRMAKVKSICRIDPPKNKG